MGRGGSKEEEERGKIGVQDMKVCKDDRQERNKTGKQYVLFRFEKKSRKTVNQIAT